jgi:hypothetical protein
MLPQEVYALLSASVGYIVVAGFIALVALLIVQRARLRTWKRAHGLIRGDCRELLDSHTKLCTASSGGDLSPDDRALLEDLADELVGCIVTGSGDPLLDDAEEVSIATIPVPVIEIVYADRLVTLRLEVEHHSEELMA